MNHWQITLKVSMMLALVLLAACTSPVFTGTLTPLPSTPIPPQATITPTISPTSTPTLTPMPKRFGECPEVDKRLIADFKDVFETYPQDFVTPVQNFLNQGGSPESVIDAFEKAEHRLFKGDLTGDDVSELGVFDNFLTVLGCVNKKYEILFRPDPEWVFGSNEIISTQDMNLNGIPDLVLYNPYPSTFMGNFSEAYIYEWDGEQFQNIVDHEYDSIRMLGVLTASVTDSDGNGTQELVTNGGVPAWFADYADGLPWREQSDTYTWNGKVFVLDQTEFSAPEYRFQAVQDGDRAVLRGDYKQALSYYQQAISNNALEWWSRERKDYEEAKVNSSFDTAATPFPQPVRDPAEKPSLAAYAYYRIMLLYIVQNMDMEAQATYEILMKSFPEKQAGYSYVEMATAFWTEYQLSLDITQACSKAVDFASTHRAEILSYLGNTSENYYHGWQSLEYSPKDVCPFDIK